jgi:hypothetical protein
LTVPDAGEGRHVVAEHQRRRSEDGGGGALAEYQVSGVRTEPAWSDTHEHVSHVRVEDGTIFVRQTVVDDLRAPESTRYFMVGRRGRAEVTVVACPECGFRDYLTTNDPTNTDLLLRLPRV